MSKIPYRGVFLDTSIWIHYFQPQGDEVIKTEVKSVLLAEQIFTCWVVKAELLVGAKDEKSFTRLDADLDAMEDVPITSEVWLKAAHLGHTLRHQGLTVPLPDLLIAQVALEEKLWLWHADEHFEYIKEIIPLKTRPFIKGK